MSLALARTTAARSLVTPVALTYPARVSPPVAAPAPTAPPMGSLKSTGVARSISLGGILGGIGGVIQGAQGGGGIGGAILGGIQGYQQGAGFPSLPGSSSSAPPALPGGAPSPNGPITTQGTAAGACFNVLGQQVCLGGSLGLGSSYQGPAAGSSTAAGATPAPRGYHVNKHGYWTKAGYVAPGTRWVKNRRRNPLNPRALSHSLGRLAGFTRAVKRTEKVVTKSLRGIGPRRSSAPRKAPCGCGGKR